MSSELECMSKVRYATSVSIGFLVILTVVKCALHLLDNTFYLLINKKAQ